MLVCLALLALPLGMIGGLCSVVVAFPGPLLYYLYAFWIMLLNLALNFTDRGALLAANLFLV